MYCKKIMLLFACVLSILFHASRCKSKQPTAICPMWTYPSPPHNECVCGATLPNIISCQQDTLTASVSTGNRICIFFSEELQTTLVGTCPYGYGGRTLPNNVSKFKEKNDKFCFHLHRTGPLCGECVENYTLPVYSYYLGCVKCESYKTGWIKFIAAAFVPLTLFYILVITFRISATSPTLKAFVMVNQVLAIPPIIPLMYSSNLVTNPYYHVSFFTQFSVDFIIVIFAIWNLDFFRSFYKPICLYPYLKYQHNLLFEYVIGVYPLLLIFLTYIIVKLHDNFAFVVWLWRPFHRCLAVFRRQWNIKSYLVHALATFIVLSYIKILNTSFEFLVPSYVFNMKGEHINKALWYYNGSVDMTSKDYLPYLVLALFMLLTFNILPLLLLALYPFKCFQTFLGRYLPPRCKIALHIYMDTFHGCYENSMRHFATLYMAIRFCNLLVISVFSYKLYAPTASLFFAFTLALVAKFQPYKSKRNNTTDIVILMAMIFGYTSSTMHTIEVVLYPKWLNGIIICTAIVIIYCYVLFLILARISLKAKLCLTRIKPYLIFKRIGEIKCSEVDVEDRTLLGHEEANYGSCH